MPSVGLSRWRFAIFAEIAEIVVVKIMNHGIKHYSFGQATRFVFSTLLLGTGIGLSVSLVASIFVEDFVFL